MRWLSAVVLSMVLAGALCVMSGQGAVGEGAGTRFEFVDVFIDSGANALAAYEVEMRALGGSVRIVGIEGGEHEAYRDAPYYDERAMQSDHVIIGAYSTLKALPKGRTRVARVHVQVQGDAPVDYDSALIVAGDASGAEIKASMELVQGEAE